MDLNKLQIPGKHGYNENLSDNFTHGHEAEVVAYFRNLEQALCENIGIADFVVGCVAWLTNDTVLDALAKVPQGVALVVQKEDFLRPDSLSSGSIRKKYERLSPGPNRYFYDGIVGGLSTHACPNIEPVRCVGNHNRDKSPAFPRMHNKFLVFCHIAQHTIVPFAVWTGSFNFTKNATQSFENAVFINNSDVAEAYFREFEQIMALSEPLDWKTDWSAPEWRIGS